MTNAHLVLPMLVMMALTIFFVFRLGTTRTRAVTNKEVDLKFYKTYDHGSEPMHLRVLTRHMQNHFENPPLFYVACIILMLLEAVNMAAVVTAWIYVVARFCHSYVHLSGNKITPRFAAFLVGVLALCGLWGLGLYACIGAL